MKDLLRAGEDDESKHEIKVDKDGNTYVTEATMIRVDPHDHTQVLLSSLISINFCYDEMCLPRLTTSWKRLEECVVWAPRG